MLPFIIPAIIYFAIATPIFRAFADASDMPKNKAGRLICSIFIASLWPLTGILLPAYWFFKPQFSKC